MNLYLRLIWLLLRLPWVKIQADPLQAATLTMRVCMSDLDLNFHANNGKILTLMDLGRIHLVAKAGLLKALIKHKWMPTLGTAKINFIRPLGFFNKFTMTTQLIYWDEKWLYIEQKIYKKEVLCVVAILKALFIGKEGKIPSDTLLSHLPNPVDKPSIPNHLKAWIEAEKVR